MAPAAASAASPRRTQRRSTETRERLVAAALPEFAEKGFEAASTRSIARRAGVALSALPYHFSTKEALWKEAVEHLFGAFYERFRTRAEALQDLDPETRAALLLKDFVRYAAAHPELHRYMIGEASAASDRLEWLVSNWVRPMYDGLQAIFDELEAAGRPMPGNGKHLFHMIIGAASTPYALAAEFRELTGEDPFADEHIEAHVAAVMALFFPTLEQRGPVHE
jgi:AcrR family transcriptional regulator